MSKLIAKVLFGGIGGLITLALFRALPLLGGGVNEYMAFAFASAVFGAVLSFMICVADGAAAGSSWTSRQFVRIIMLSAAINAVAGLLSLLLLNSLPFYDGSPNRLYGLAVTAALGAGPGAGFGMSKARGRRSIEVFALAGFIGSAIPVLIAALYLFVTRYSDLSFDFDLWGVSLSGMSIGLSIAVADMLCAKCHKRP